MARTYTRAQLVKAGAARRARIRAERAHDCAVNPECMADPQSAAAATVCYDGKGPRPTGAYHVYRSAQRDMRVQRVRAAKYNVYAEMDVDQLDEELGRL